MYFLKTITSALIFTVLCFGFHEAVCIDNGENQPMGKAIFKVTESSNLLPNPAFNDGTSYWMLGKYEGGKGKLCVGYLTAGKDDPSALVVTENNIESPFMNVQLFNALSLQKDVNYSIMFSARVTKASLISIRLSNGTETFFEEVLLLTPEQDTYGPFEYNCTTDESLAFFSINLGKTSGNLYFDNVLVLEDKTEKLFNEILAKSGVNIHQPEGQEELFIQLPACAEDDLPLLIVGPRDRIVKTMHISKGSQETSIDFSEYTTPGHYLVQVITPFKTLAWNFNVR